MGSLVTVLLLGALACSGGPATPAEVDVTAPADTPELLLGDLLHLLRNAVSAHGAGDLVLAERHWSGAVGIWREVIGPIVREEDALRALQLEYDLGRLGSALRRSTGAPAPLWRTLDEALRELEPTLASSGSAPPSAAGP